MRLREIMNVMMTMTASKGRKMKSNMLQIKYDTTKKILRFLALEIGSPAGGEIDTEAEASKGEGRNVLRIHDRR